MELVLQYWSESKEVWIDVGTMATPHLKNAIAKLEGAGDAPRGRMVERSADGVSATSVPISQLIEMMRKVLEEREAQT